MNEHVKGKSNKICIHSSYPSIIMLMYIFLKISFRPKISPEKIVMKTFEVKSVRNVF